MHRLMVLLIVFAAGTAPGCAPGAGDASGQPPFKPVASVEELMHGIVIPASDAVFNAVVYINGEPETVPTSPEDWETIQDSAIALAESGNLLMFPSRSEGREDWNRMSLELIDAAMLASQAAADRDIDAVLAAGSEIYDACVACHEQYVVEEPEE